MCFYLALILSTYDFFFDVYEATAYKLRTKSVSFFTVLVFTIRELLIVRCLMTPDAKPKVIQK